MATEAIQPMIAALTISGIIGVGLVSIAMVKRARTKAKLKAAKKLDESLPKPDEPTKDQSDTKV